jgi:hypothetical protein
MNKIFLGTGLIFLGMTLSCTSCSNKEVMVESPVVPTVEIPVLPVTTNPDKPTPPTLIKGKGWQFSVSSEWNVLETSEPGVEVLVISKDNKDLILVAKDNCLVEPTVCIKSSIQSLKDNGATIISTKEVNVNNNHFYLVKSTLDDIQVSAWLSITQNNVLIFSCGGPINSNIENTCEQIVKTLNTE